MLKLAVEIYKVRKQHAAAVGKLARSLECAFEQLLIAVSFKELAGSVVGEDVADLPYADCRAARRGGKIFKIVGAGGRTE